MVRHATFARAAGTALAILFLLFAASGCANLPEPDPAAGDCQLRAGSLAGEAGYDPFAGFQGVGGAYTRIGQCVPTQDRVFSRSPNGSVICHGDEAWCNKALSSQPVTGSPAQLRELIGVDE